jgi:hypothetical protein
MYAMVKNVARPPRISREIVEPRSEIAKKRSIAERVSLTGEEWQQVVSCEKSQ